MTRTVRLIIAGRVQGVGYRAWVEREANARGLAGWVRNRRDGTVEALISGETTAVDGMIEAARSGPRMAEVADMKITDESADPGLRGFRTIATA